MQQEHAGINVCPTLGFSLMMFSAAVSLSVTSVYVFKIN